MLVAGDFGEAAVFRTADWSVVRFANYQHSYPQFQFTPAGDALRLTFVDKVGELPLAAEGPERTWPLPKLDSSGHVHTTADGRYVVLRRGYEDAIDVWETATGKRVQTFHSRYGTHLVAEKSGLIVYETRNGFAVVRLGAAESKPLLTDDEPVASAAISPEDRYLLTTAEQRRGGDGLSFTPLSAAEDDPFARAARTARRRRGATAERDQARGGRRHDRAAAARAEAVGLDEGEADRQRHVPRRAAAVHFSASGKTVAVVSAGKRQQHVRVFTVPDLRLLGEVSVATSGDSHYSDPFDGTRGMRQASRRSRPTTSCWPWPPARTALCSMRCRI